MQDLYSATRASVREPWSTPVNLGPLVNSPGRRTRVRRSPGTARRSTSGVPPGSPSRRTSS
jgi:hypothetical protein